jgi:hypothetical protein
VCFYILRRRKGGKKSGFVHFANKTLHFRAKTAKDTPSGYACHPSERGEMLICWQFPFPKGVPNPCGEAGYPYFATKIHRKGVACNAQYVRQCRDNPTWRHSLHTHLSHSGNPANSANSGQHSPKLSTPSPLYRRTAQ